MLWQRVVTSIILIALVLSAVFSLPSSWFLLFILFIVTIACWEWSSLAGLKSIFTRALYVTALLAVMVMSTYKDLSLPLVIYAAVVFWLVVLFLIYSFPETQKFWGEKGVLIVMGFPLLVPAWLTFYYLRSQNFHEFHILFLLSLVATADIGAYFVGRTFGRHKLAVRVSPNKTWEGFAGGMLACSLVVLGTTLFFADKLPALTVAYWVKLVCSGLLIAAFSVAGDLFESMVKRRRGVKDSGTILPGHGGVLDRIDGLTAAAPFYVLIIMQLGLDHL